MPADFSGVYAFASFTIDPRDRQLRRDGRLVRLTPKAADLLVALVESAGELVTKQALIERVWPSTFVEEGNLTFHVHQLRQKLGDAAAQPIYIETVAGRGYRFICPVSRISEPAAGVPAPAASPSVAPPPVAPAPIGAATEMKTARPRPRWRRSPAIAALLVLIALTVAIAIDARDQPLPVLAGVTYLTRDGRNKSELALPDESRLSFRIDDERYELRLSDHRLIRRPDLDEYEFLDASLARGEFLARRPNDRGAELGLWAVRSDGSARRRLGMAKAAGPAAWSRDGRRIAYAAGSTLYVTDADGGGQQTVASFTGILSRLRWSPRDEFLRVDVTFLSDRTVTSVIYDVGLDDTNPRPLVGVPRARVVCCGTWLPNSEDYLFEAGDRAYDLWILRASRGRFWRRPPLLRQLTSLGHATNHDYPVAANDGSRAYVVARTAEGLTTYDPARRSFVPYLGGLQAFAVEPSPDARWLTYIDRSSYTLWRANAGGSNRQPLTPPGWHVGASAWRPDGAQLAILAIAPGARVRKVYLLSADGGIPTPIDGRDVEQGIPSWSADGTRLAFGDVPEQYGHPSGTERIHVVDVRTGKMTDVPGSSGLWSSRWSPDGRHLAATRIVDRTLFLYDFASNQWRDLGVTHVGELRWSRDGAHIYCEPERPEVWLRRIRVADGHVERVVDTSGQDIEFGGGWTSDGRPLFLRMLADIAMVQVERR